MEKKLRIFLITSSFVLFSFIVFKNVSTQIQKVNAVQGDLTIGSQVDQTMYFNNESIYNDDLKFGNGSGGRGGMLSADGTVVIAPTGTPTDAVVLDIVTGRTKARSVSVGINPGATKPLDVAGDANLQGNVGIGTGVSTTLTAPLTVYRAVANPALIMLQGTDNTVTIGENAGNATINNNIEVRGVGNSTFAGNIAVTGTSALTGATTVTGALAANGGLTQDGNTILNGTDTWLRTTGSTGWVSATYGGGWYMTDASWIRSYGSKGIYQDTGILRTDGNLQVGGSGATLNVVSGGNMAYRTDVLVANTAGNVGIGTTAPTQKFELGGNGTATSPYAVINGLRVSGGDTGNTLWNGARNISVTANSGQKIGLYQTSTTTGLTVDTASGNVGVGTTAPTSNLQVAGRVETGRLGTVGTYDSYQVQGIWSIGRNYGVDTTNNNFGTQYGMVYAHTNAGTGAANQPIAGFGHQIDFVSSGTVNAAIGLSGQGYFAGNVGIGTNAPATKLHVAGSVRGNSSGGALRIDTGNGYVDVGPQNTSWAHFTTDRANFYFGSPIHVNGGICKYGSGCAIVGSENNIGDYNIASSTTGNTSYPYASIELRESNFGGSSAYTPPRLSFHWGGVVASQIGITSNGTIQILNNPGTALEKLQAGRLGINGAPASNNTVYVNADMPLSYAGDWVANNTYAGGGFNATSTNRTMVALQGEANAYTYTGGYWTYNFGVKGIAHGSSFYSAGVWGWSDNTGSSPVGVKGTQTYNMGIGVRGEGTGVNGVGGLFSGGSTSMGYAGGTGIAVAGTNFGFIESGPAGSKSAFSNPLGIGTWYPTAGYMLDIEGKARVNGEVVSASLTNSSGQFRMIQGSYGAFLRNDGSSTYFLLTAANDQYGSWNGLRPWAVNNASGYVTFGNGHNDLAENYNINGKVLRGSLVSISDSGKMKATAADTNNGAVIGVVSTMPGAIMDADGGFVIGPPTKVAYSNEKAPVALQGTAPTLVTTANGTIAIGDAIAVSSIPGFGVKANTAGLTVGRALEVFDPSSCPTVSSVDSIAWPKDDGKNTKRPCFRLPDGTYVGKIMIALGPTWYDPDVMLTSTGSLEIKGSGDTYEVKDTGTDTLIKRIGTFAQLVVAEIQAGVIEARRVVVDGVDILKELSTTKQELKQTQDTVVKQGEQLKQLQQELESLKTQIKK